MASHFQDTRPQSTIFKISKPIQLEEKEDSTRPPINYVLTNFYKTLIDFSYFMLLSPFRLKYSKLTNSFSVVQSYVQKFLCGITYLLLLIWLLGIIRKYTPNGTTSAFQVLVLFHVIASALSKLVILFSFWKHKNDFVNILNFIVSTPTNLVHPNSKFVIALTTKYFVYTVLASLVAIAIQAWIAGNGVHEANWKLSGWTINWWLGRILANTRYTYFVDESIANTTDINITNLSAGNIILLVVGTYGYFVRYLMSAYSSIYFICATLTLWIVVKSFSNLLKNEKGNLNETLGSSMIWYTINILFDFATSLDDVLLEGGILGLKHIQYHLFFCLLYYFGTFAIFYYFAVDICSQVKT